jgi:hypothetical protein
MAKNIIPKTKTPANIISILLAMVVGLGILLFFLFGLWGILILFVSLAFSTSLYTSGVPAFHALILVNSWTGTMRVVFPGINWKLPWEDTQDEYIDLRVELSEAPSETYASKDALMEAKYVYTIRPNISEENGENAEEKILRFSSFEPSAIKEKGKALFSMLLSDHYGDNVGADLLAKEKINEEVFGTEEKKADKIIAFEKKHGVQVTARLEDSDFDKATQKFRDMISGAKSFDEAIAILVEGGRTPVQAEKIVKLMNLDGYTETDFNLNVDAPHLTNVRDITVLGGLGSQSKGKEGKK